MSLFEEQLMGYELEQTMAELNWNGIPGSGRDILASTRHRLKGFSDNEFWQMLRRAAEKHGYKPRHMFQLLTEREDW